MTSRYRNLMCAVAVLSLGAATPSAVADEFTKEELEKWRAQFENVREKGEALFHDPTLGGNNVSCDMCHPNASNTHPETYPKLQQQIGEVATLRDMINWCIENPLEGEPLELDSQEMLQLEAYITAERRGEPLDPGKH